MQFTDQMGRTISLEATPRRIISLVPSQTELLADLGLEAEVAGITKFCIHPDSWFRSKTRIGGTKQFDLEKIAALQPDLIIGNKEENERDQVETLMQHFPVWMSDIRDLDGSLAMIRGIGEITGRSEKANSIAAEIEKRFAEFRTQEKNFIPKRVAYFIWKNPWMTAGGDTFIDSMLRLCGWENIFSSNGRYPEVTLDELKNATPDLVLLSSEPYPFKEKHIAELQAVLPEAKILTVDGELFSWYGSRLLHSPEYLLQLQRTISTM
jgi:ABC-type Fe3+-hydroxamate transport system substrate-binding protein